MMLRLDLKVYLEIGTWTGESISTISEIAEYCYSVSLPDNDEGLIKVFEKYCNKNNFSRFFQKILVMLLILKKILLSLIIPRILKRKWI
ncbi:hypothetical protein AAHH67_06875 [Niallia circulans]